MLCDQHYESIDSLSVSGPSVFREVSYGYCYKCRPETWIFVEYCSHIWSSKRKSCLRLLNSLIIFYLRMISIQLNLTLFYRHFIKKCFTDFVSLVPPEAEFRSKTRLAQNRNVKIILFYIISASGNILICH